MGGRLTKGNFIPDMEHHTSIGLTPPDFLKAKKKIWTCLSSFEVVVICSLINTGSLILLYIIFLCDTLPVSPSLECRLLERRDFIFYVFLQPRPMPSKQQEVNKT